jgi:hypothetical protein
VGSTLEALTPFSTSMVEHEGSTLEAPTAFSTSMVGLQAPSSSVLSTSGSIYALDEGALENRLLDHYLPLNRTIL